MRLLATLNTRHFAKFKTARAAVFVLASLVILSLPTKTTAQEAPPPSAPPPAEQKTINPKLPSLFIVGDSTANNNAKGQQGWADPFVDFFDTTKINVVNRARAGRSSRTFMTEGLWDNALELMTRGDTVLIQFGHNDGGPLDTGRARGSLPGIGEETREVARADGRKEVVYTYGHYLRGFIADAKAKGVTPILLSLTVRNIWKDGKVERGSGKFGQWAAEVARSEGVAFIDVTNIIADRYDALGQEKVQLFFGGDHTHTSPMGASFNANAVVSGLRGLKDCPPCAYLSLKGTSVPPHRPE